MVFQPGQSGNPKGRRREKPFADALRMEIADAGDDRRKLRAIARALLDKAEAGDTQAIREVADRLDGKVPQAVVGEEGEQPLQFELIRRVIVGPDNRDSPNLPAPTGAGKV